MIACTAIAAALLAALPARVWWLGVPDLHGRVGSAFDRRAFNPVAVEAAP